MSKKIILLLIIGCFFRFSLSAQILISEVAAANTGQIQDEDGDAPDWFEIYNAGFTPVALNGYSLSDRDMPGQWYLPDFTLDASSRLLVFASGKNKGAIVPASAQIDHWETAVNEGDSWRYFIGTVAPPANWAQTAFNANAWSQGAGGFGYGDNDDVTVVPSGTASIFIRRNFNISDTALIAKAILSMDYDDGYIAYLNGVEIGRSNNLPLVTQWNTLTSGEHEAVLYGGGTPEQIILEKSQLNALLRPGANVLAIQVHNTTLTSSDLSARAWFHVGIKTSAVLFGPNPNWFSVDEEDPGFTGELHSNFKLGYGERLSLFKPNGALQDSIRLVQIQPGHARMRLSDQGNWCYTDQPSPNAPNGSLCKTGYAVMPQFNLAPGFYSGTQTVSISGAGPIRYTTNGDEPNAASTLYTVPINISQTTVLRARSFLANRLPSRVNTATYLLDDPTSLPVVSITIDPDDFSDVYDNYSKKGRVNVEYFDQNRQLQLNTESSGYVVGNWSVGFPQKSLEFESDEKFGAQSEFEYPLFAPDKPINHLRSFRIRNEDDDWNGARMRDRIVNELAAPTHAGRASYRHVSGFINGQYWGHFVARENLDPFFCRDNYGANPDSVNMVKTHYGIGDYVAVSGTTDDFFAMSDFIMNNTMTQAGNYEKAKQLLDIENFTDYFATEIYVASTDWLQDYFNNVRLFKSNKNDRWKFILWDVSYSSGAGSGCESCNVLASTINNPFNSRYGRMFNQLLNNSGYKRFFINRFADLLNTAFLPERANALISASADELSPEINRQNLRWGSGDQDHWMNQVDGLRTFYNNRPAFQRQHIQDQFNLVEQVNITLQVNPPGAGHIQISTITPKDLPWTGVYFSGNPVTMTAIPAPGYTFSNWSPNVFINNLNAQSFSRDITSNTTVTANFSGSPLLNSVYIREVNYHSDSTRNANDWIELHNNSAVAIDISNWKIQDENWFNQFLLPIGTTIPANGSLVVVEDSSKFMGQHPGVLNFIGETGFEFNNNGDAVRLFDAQGTVVDTFRYKDNDGWPCTADGYGRTMERSTATNDPKLPESWFEGCIGGSPGVAYSPCVQEVYFSEINYNSDVALDAGDWIELKNPGNNAVSLANWSIRDQSDINLYIIPSGVSIPAQGYHVFFSDAAKFNQVFPNVTNKTGPTNIPLSNAGDVIRLYNSQGKLSNSVCYNDKLPWPETADGQGFTLEALLSAGNQALSNNWVAACYGGSPGTAYDPDCGSVGVNHAGETGYLKVYPNPASRELTLELDDNTRGLLRITDAFGRTVKTMVFEPVGMLRVPIGDLPAGWYQLSVETEKWVKTSGLVVQKGG